MDNVLLQLNNLQKVKGVVKECFVVKIKERKVLRSKEIIMGFKFGIEVKKQRKC